MDLFIYTLSNSLPILLPLVGVLIGSWITLKVSKSQIDSNLKQKRIEFLQKQIEILQYTLQQISDNPFHVDAVIPSQVQSRVIDGLVRHIGIFLQVSYMFPKSFQDEVQAMQKDISQCIYDAKISKPVSEERSRKILERAPVIHADIISNVHSKLMSLYEEAEKVVQSLQSS